MTSAQIAWLFLLTLLASGLCNLALLNPILTFVAQMGSRSLLVRAPLTVLILSLLFHAGVAIGLAVGISLDIAIVLISLAGFIWSLSSYFLLQRFVGIRSDTISLVRGTPSFLPITSFVCFISSIIALWLIVSWYWAFALPVLIWFTLGFICAEIAIRHFINQARAAGRDCDRCLAIFSINSNQGRENILRGERYPFP